MQGARRMVLTVGVFIVIAGAVIVGQILNRDANAVVAEGPLAAIVVFSDSSGQLHDFDTREMSSRALPAADHFTSVRLSPSGRVVAGLAASEARGQEQRLHVIDRETDQVVELSLGSEDIYTELVWSPVGEYLALVGTTTMLIGGNGVVLASSAAHRSEKPGYSELNSGGYAWAEDGRSFALSVNGSIVVMSVNGQVDEVESSSIVSLSGRQVSLRGWSGADAVVESDGVLFRLEFSGAQTSATPVAGLTLDKYDRVEAEREAQHALSSEGQRLAWSHLSASGGSAIGLVMGSDGGNGALVVMSRVQLATVRIQGLDYNGIRGVWVVDGIALD